MDILEDRAPLNSQRVVSSRQGPGAVHREVRTADGWYEAVREVGKDGKYVYHIQALVEPTAAWTAAYDARVLAQSAIRAEEDSQRTKLQQVLTALSQDPAGLSEAQFRRITFRALKHALKGSEA